MTFAGKGYDSFYNDGDSMRDEEWRFEPETESTVVSRRNGFRDKDNFYFEDSLIDAFSGYTKSKETKNEKDLIKQRVKGEPQMNKERDRTGVMKTASNGFSGVSISTQYDTHNEFPHIPNVVGNQQLNTPSIYQSLNFHQAFSGFGFEHLFNHQVQAPSNPLTIPSNNHYIQLPSFLMFFNQNNYSPNHHQTFATGIDNNGMTNEPFTTEQQNVISSTVKSTDAAETLQNATEPIVDAETTMSPTTSTQTVTKIDPTLDFDVRLEEEKTLTTNETVTQSIPTVSRRPIEGLPTSDEDYADEEGVLDDKINQQVLKTLVG